MSGATARQEAGARQGVDEYTAPRRGRRVGYGAAGGGGGFPQASWSQPEDRAQRLGTSGGGQGDSDLSSIVDGARRGDTEAWSEIVGRFAGLAWAIARSEGCDVADAADACQTTWLRLVEHIDRIEDPERLAGWIATVTRRESRRLAARRKMAVSVADEQGVFARRYEFPADAPVLGRERDEILWGAVQRLSPKHRLLLRLTLLDPPLSYAEVADALDVPVGSIGPTRARAIESLRRDADIIALGCA